MIAPTVIPFRVKAAAVLLGGFLAGIGIAAALGGTSPKVRTTASPIATMPRTVTASVPSSSTTPPPFLASTAYKSFTNEITVPLRPSTVEIAVVPTAGGEAVVLGGNSAMPAGTTLDVPILVALFKASGSSGLTSSDQAAAKEAVEQFDGHAGTELFRSLAAHTGGAGPAGQFVERILRATGDTDTRLPTEPSALGSTRWTPRDAALFFGSLSDGCLLNQAQTSFVLRLMQNVDPLGREGLGSTDFQPRPPIAAGATLRSSSNVVVSQAGIVTVGSGGFAVSIMGQAPAGQDSDGLLSVSASWLHTNLVPVPRGRGTLCSNARGF